MNEERRSFLKWCTHGIGAAWAGVLSLPVIGYLIDPRNRPVPPGEFRPVARLDELTVDVPHQVVIRNLRRDAWTLHPNDILGRVWLIKRSDNSVEAFTTICPHLGCSVNFQEGAKQFICPCHNGTFRLSGERIDEEELGRPNPAPRSMDKLETRIAKGEIAVKYENFIQGKEEKELKA